MDCSYYNDVLTRREQYENDSICLVAEEAGKIIGLIDIEIEPEAGSLCVAGRESGAVIWHLAVLPEYRRNHVAVSLWEEAEKQLSRKGIRYCEVWTQEDEASNRWYYISELKIRKYNTFDLSRLRRQLQNMADITSDLSVRK